LAQVRYAVQAESAAHCELTVLVHEPPVPRALPRHVSQASPGVLTVPSMQYSNEHWLAHGPPLAQTQFWMIVT
jgi:hypothetical protein